MEDNKQQAILQFESGDYRGAFLAFRALYNASQDEDERQLVLRILQEGYYLPNEEELRENYRKNCGLLGNYPFQMGYKERPFDALPVCLFPVTEREYCLYDKKEQRFSELLVIESEDLTDYMFEHLDQPVFRENECDLYQLRYLWDNVRRSEDFGGDNHIYLYYSEWSQILPLLLFGELEPLLKDHKFVFLIGAESKKHYPLDFKKQFQIDYAAMGPQKLRIEEMKRICFWYKHAHSGSGLSIRLLGALDQIQLHIGYGFNTYSEVRGSCLYNTKEFRDSISDIDRRYTVAQIENMISSGQYHFRSPRLGEYLEWLKAYRSAPHEYTVKELFCGYFLFLYEERALNPRVVPLLLYEPHMWDPSPYNELVMSFPYRTALTCVREPIMTFARCQMIGIAGWDQFSTKYLLAFDYASGQFLHPNMRSDYYGFRFEDLKTRPEIVCRALCQHLNIPYDPRMLEVETPADNAGQRMEGVNYSAPLHWDISKVMSEFDALRLKMFYDPILRYYGYPTFSFEEYSLSDELVRELFQVPFRFEYANPQIHKRSAPSWDQFHSWIQDVLQNAWKKNFISPKLIPLEEP